MLTIPAVVLISLFCFSRILSQKTENYIFDIRYPLIFSYNKTEKFTHFGVSVAFALGPLEYDKDRPSAWIFIGAPTKNSSSSGNNQPEGALWRCSIGRGYEDSTTRSEVCKIVNIDPAIKPRRDESPYLEEHDFMWTGGSLKIREGRLVTCGHRHTRGGKTYMNGLCYFFNETSSTKSESYVEQDGPLPTRHSHRLLPFFIPEPPGTNDKEQNFNFTTTPKGGLESGTEWGMGQVGTSLHIVPKINTNDTQEILLGAPGARQWSGAVVRYRDNPSTEKGPNFRLNRDEKSPIFSEFVTGHRGLKTQKNGHWYEYFGYGLSSGKYFDKEKVYYAGGAPRGRNLSGDVVIFDYLDEEIYKRQINPILTISPKLDTFGSYFGSVLFSLDVNGDGRDELMISAPHLGFTRTRSKRSVTPEWSGDHGCVFVYFFNANKSINGEPRVIQSDTQAPGARFGSAISYTNTWTSSVGNILKARTYIIIGAPYENSGRGAIYIFTYVSPHFQLVQKVLASELSDELLGFGSSISLPWDVDLNETPDIAVGAYPSSQVVVIRTRPTVFVEGEVLFEDKSRSSMKDGKISKASKTFFINSCIKVMEVVGKARGIDLFVTLTFDKRLSVNKTVPRLHKLHDETYLYRENIDQISKGEPICLENFEVVVNPSKDIDISKSYKIIQSIWYNFTILPSMSDKKENISVLQYKISSLGTATKLGTTELRDFQSNLPYPIQQISQAFFGDIVPNDCRKAICKPDLRFKVEWIDVVKNRTLDSHSTQSNPIILGSISKVVFKLEISNFNETAITPSYSIEWQRNIGVVIDEQRVEKNATDNLFLQTDNCKENFLASKIVYNCNFPTDITKLAPMTLIIPLSFMNAYATQLLNNFTIDFSMRPKDAKNRISVNSWLQLKANSTIELVGSKTKVTGLISKSGRNKTEDGELSGKTKLVEWKQTYWVHVKGISGVKVYVQLAFPYSRKKSDTSSSVLIRTKIASNNTFCKSDPNNDQQIEVADVDHMPPSSEAGGSIHGDDIKPSDIQKEENTILGFPTTFKALNNDALMINCDKNRPDIAFDCFLINCDIIVLGESSVELGFELTMMKNDTDFMLSEDQMQDLLVVSYGYAKTVFEAKFVNDTAQTLFKHALSPVGAWVYVVSIIVGFLILLCVGFLLHKVGFFKREEKEKLELLKSEARKSVMIPNFKLDEECLEQQ